MPHKRSISPRSAEGGDFTSLEASEMFCTRCRRAVPVRKRLLLVLMGEERFDYHCVFCGAVVGGKTETANVPTVLIHK